MVKLLLFRGSPRSNILEVEEPNKNLPCDRLIVQYLNEFEAYKFARDYFLSHTQYDYLVLATDDIVVKDEHIQILKADLDYEGYPVLGGMMNVDEVEDGRLNITWTLPMTERTSRAYAWIYRNDLDKLVPDKNIFQVAFEGFALMAIRRDIVEQYEFNTDGIFRGTGVAFGASLDFVFCHWCAEHKIPVMVDKTINLRHLRASGKMMVGLQKPDWYLMRSYSSAQFKDNSSSLYKLKQAWKEFEKQGKMGNETQNKYIDVLHEYVTSLGD